MRSYTKEIVKQLQLNMTGRLNDVRIYPMVNYFPTHYKASAHVDRET